jgi:putative transposase
MQIPPSMPRLKGFRFPPDIIVNAVWAYYRFAISTGDVEDLLAERGIVVSQETIRLWVNRFGSHFADCIRRVRSRPNDEWHSNDGAARQCKLACTRGWSSRLVA